MERPNGMRKIQRTKRVVSSALLAALCTVILVLGYYTSAEWTAIFVVSFLLWIAYEIGGASLCFMTTVVTNVLAIVFIPNPAFLFTLAFISGYTPVRAILNKLNSPLAWGLRYLYFNLAFFSWFLLNTYVLGLEDILNFVQRYVSDGGTLSTVIVLIMLVGLEVMFFIYEILFQRFEKILRRRLTDFTDKFPM
ncbi:hypothetical protein [Fervidobacterium thailandense]|uniref:DUF2232 domain-containing protein n=1 Tax=Fervidobacterium thailandense TaxID=1008305 RepID=A0A1E3G0B8_9BACT|nr:hypothetical protein [Fervidobacterium thailandense]ODN29665.1 hypothetical protein A4H02_09550 [Fervidobacterium thailandense]